MNFFGGLNDEDLWDLLKNNDERAYQEIYERYHAVLYSYAYKKLLNKQEAQDVVQDALVNLWNRRESGTAGYTLPSYLIAAVRNKAFDIFAHRRVEEKYMDSLQHYMEITATTDHLVREKEMRELIACAIASLPPRMQEIFNMSRKDRLTNKEIAALLELSTYTVDTQIKRALKILKERLGPYYLLIYFLLK